MLHQVQTNQNELEQDCLELTITRFKKKKKDFKDHLDRHLGLHLALQSFSHGLQKDTDIRQKGKIKTKRLSKISHLVKLNKDLDS